MASAMEQATVEYLSRTMKANTHTAGPYPITDAKQIGRWRYRCAVQRPRSSSGSLSIPGRVFFTLPTAGLAGSIFILSASSTTPAGVLGRYDPQEDTWAQILVVTDGDC